jgi:uncharacterized membrane protein YdbT with pleckstrin-like domain
VLDLTADQAEQIRQIAAELPTKKSSTVFSRVAEGVLQLLVAFALAAVILAFVLFRLGRMF